MTRRPVFFISRRYTIHMNTILVCGFERFGPYSHNVAEQCVRQLDGWQFTSDYHIWRVVGLVLPLCFRDFRQLLNASIEQTKPIIALGLGLDFKDQSDLAFELVAHRQPRYDEALPDNEGKQGSNTALDDLAEVLRVPNENALSALIAKVAGINLSEQAGGYTCETVLRDLIRLSREGKKFQPAFIHLPHTKDLLLESRQLVEHYYAKPLSEQISVLKTVLRALTTLSSSVAL